MKRIALFLMGMLLTFGLNLAGASAAHAACAKVSIEILQELTLERVAFDAKLVITNGIPDQSLQDVRVDVVVRDFNGNVKNDVFFVRPPTLSGIGGALDGSGSVAPSGRGEAHWLIIPSPGAGYIEDQDGAIKQIGVDYLVGATLSYTINGLQETVPINPAKITVKPMPQLVLDYFMPYAVLGDDPFTPKVEPPIPYPLAVRILNDGYGLANNLKIDSAQPKIVDNKQGLLIDFRILGASVNDGPVSPSLTVNFGNLGSKKVGTAAWTMISTLSGHFIEFKTSFSHASELGGELTSLLRETNSHFLTHMVKVNLPGRDNKLDFLADLDNSGGYIYESEIPNGSTKMADAKTPVTVVLPSPATDRPNPDRPTPDKPVVTLTLPTGTAVGWIYTKLDDPSQGMLKLLSVTRSDGVRLDTNNFWVDEGLDTLNHKKSWTLQFIDYRVDPNTTGVYTLAFTTPDVDMTPPSTELIFDGPAVGTAPTCITPKTRLVLTATDNDGGSGVDAMYRKVVGIDNDFIPALPFTLDSAGDTTSTVQFYSTDRAGNVETTKSVSVKVIAAAPTIGSFNALPATFAPQAPRGVAAARTIDFAVTATSPVASLPVEIAIAPGTAFQADQVLRTLKGAAESGKVLHIAWDGKDASGKLVATGSYTARVKVSDGLDNLQDATAPSHTVTSDTTVTAAEWFVATALDPNPTADQLHPFISGTKVVWQDQRNGVWDIYVKDAVSGTAARIPGISSGRERPSIDGNIVVWQDQRSGGWEIYGYNLSTSTEFAIATGTGGKERPTVAGDWVAWQDQRSGNWDIWAKNISTSEVLQITSHERDQLHPRLNGSTLVWEDYRHGLGEVYAYDLTSRTERQVASGPADIFSPAVSGQTVVWADRRNSQADIFSLLPGRTATRLTYATGDHTQAALNGDLLVYTDYETSPDDPNLSFRVLSSGVGGRLISDPARQEEPAVGAGVVVWQDNRGTAENPDKHFQIYTAALQTESLPVEITLKPGFNLVAMGNRLVSVYDTAAKFLTAFKDTLGIERVLVFEPLHNSYTEATPATGDFAMTKGMALSIYTTKAGSLTVADPGESTTYALLPGSNQVGILSVPFGYSAYDLMNSLGFDNVLSVRRFDPETGLWRSVTVRDNQASKKELVGSNFPINSGDGVMVTMKNRVDGWTP
jgi:beta propeller repeat protein